MAASSKFMINEAERQFPVRIRVAVPATGLGTRLNDMHAWLDANCGADGWALTPAGMRGVVNDAVAIYFRDVICTFGGYQVHPKISGIFYFERIRSKNTFQSCPRCVPI